MSPSPQSFENHAKYVTGYHRIGVPLIALPTLYLLGLAVADFGPERLAVALLGVGAAICAFYARFFAVRNQDRIIRLEERLRMERILPPEFQPRIGEITADQFVAPRFAPDEEVPELVGRIFEGELTERKEIKAAIRSWRPDHMRV